MGHEGEISQQLSRLSQFTRQRIWPEIESRIDSVYRQLSGNRNQPKTFPLNNIDTAWVRKGLVTNGLDDTLVTLLLEGNNGVVDLELHVSPQAFYGGPSSILEIKNPEAGTGLTVAAFRNPFLGVMPVNPSSEIQQAAYWYRQSLYARVGVIQDYQASIALTKSALLLCTDRPPL